MEIRIGNTISINEIGELKKVLDKFFKTDLNIVVSGTYVYLRER